ncbi:multiple sugar transport system substrate-binding protein [Diaminobutyricimonas aerilata]|uniref:Multiple sugar transport system substrate-binding protein n=1 Tax=Diaminobutyricimonas aerilata TaxID=1162967 RepID=A0A2M9CNB6_9MICO|nr:extracellular solute-binding protein [Diaminobutyricimonas aerilata]PJJ73344.1 multiple sugar transport system substrate-binding protein [Diaminobutyricimonas aerilata]
MNTNRRTAARAGAALAVVGVMTALAGCASSAPASDGSLDMYTWVSSESDRAQWESFVSLAQKEDPNLKISIDGPSFADYWTKVKTRLSGNNPPCLLTTQAARAQELSGLLMPLDDLIEKHDFDTSEFDESMLQGMTVDGTIRAIPYDAEPVVLYYNADLFAAAGLTPPGVEYTREQFIADAKALTTGEQKGLAISTGIFIPNAWTLADGVAAVDDDGGLALTEPDFVDQVQQFFDLVGAHGVAEAPEAADGSDVSQAAFTSGKAAMLIEGPWMYGTFDEAADFTMGISIVPSTSGEAAAMTAGSGFGIAQNCDDPDAAFEAITHLTATPVLEGQAETRGIVPSRAEAVPAWSNGKSPEAAEVVDALLGNATAQITTPTWNQVETLFTQYAVEGFRGDKTAEEILQTIANSVGE